MRNREGEGHRADKSPDSILLGTIIRAHGLRGEVKVRPFTESPENFIGYRRLSLAQAGDQNKVPKTCLQARVSGGLVILRLEGCESREEAESLIGCQLWLNQAELPPAGPDEFYLCYLEGKPALTPSGIGLGTIVGVMSAGGQNTLVLRYQDRELLIPAVRAFIVEVTSSHVVLDPPPGLLELNL